MPKTHLLVLRHAHAAKGRPGQDDHTRDLDERGRREGEALCREMVTKGYRAERVLCSTAARTRQTYDLVAPALEGVEVEFLDDLFSCDTAGYLEHVRLQGDVGSVLVIGHNPMVAELAAMLTMEGEPEAMERLATGFPPASLAVLEFESPLGELQKGSGHLRALTDPKAL